MFFSAAPRAARDRHVRPESAGAGEAIPDLSFFGAFVVMDEGSTQRLPQPQAAAHAVSLDLAVAGQLGEAPVLRERSKICSTIWGR